MLIYAKPNCGQAYGEYRGWEWTQEHIKALLIQSTFVLMFAESGCGWERAIEEGVEVESSKAISVRISGGRWRGGREEEVEGRDKGEGSATLI